jgi:hypothetical protein
MEAFLKEGLILTLAAGDVLKVIFRKRYDMDFIAIRAVLLA